MHMCILKMLDIGTGIVCVDILHNMSTLAISLLHSSHKPYTKPVSSLSILWRKQSSKFGWINLFT